MPGLALKSVGLICLALQAAVVIATGPQTAFQDPSIHHETLLEGSCPQQPPLYPEKHHEFDITLENLYKTEAFKEKIIDALSAVVRVPSESYDDFGPVGDDPRWKSFGTLHSVLENLFPRVYQHLHVTKVNTYAPVFHWKGSNATLKPLLLTGHMDVVPVDPSSFDSWVHPPYSGYYDGTWLWGRGSCDDKIDVVSLLTTVDSLLEQGFTPSRTLVIAFGIDEESGGRRGALEVGKYLEETYGKDSFVALLDEGLPSGPFYGGDVIFAPVSTGEKGYFDLRIEVTTLGGHSSVPPPHTGIGILASAVTELEAHPHETSLERAGTLFQQIQCAAAYGPDVPNDVRQLAKRAADSDDALAELKRALVAWNPTAGAQLATTQAVDLISGGVKVNALPEQVYAVVNHRIAEHSSVAALQERTVQILTPVALRYNLTFEAFGRNVTAGTGKGGHLALSDAFGTALEPAPMTPTVDSAPYALLAGTILSAYKSVKGDGKVVVQPTLALGNTDTKHYWNLTKHIFRYGHASADGYYNGAHTINEAIKPTNIIEKIGFFTKFILNWDESSI